MDAKKKYISPELFRVKLDPSQAILAVCSASSRTIRSTNPSNWNVCGSCKHRRARTGRCNSAANS